MTELPDLQPDQAQLRQAMPEDLHGHLSRLAVLHPVPGDTFSDIDGSSTYHDRTERRHSAGRYIAENANSVRTPDYVTLDHVSLERSQTVQAIGQAISSEVAARTEEMGVVHWPVISGDLLKRASTAETEAEKNVCLVGAVACTQFSPIAQDRADFLRTVYNQGMEADMAAACAASDLVLLIQEGHSRHAKPAVPLIHPIKKFAPAFEMNAERLYSYLDSVQGFGTEESLPTPKRMQKDVVEHLEAGEIDEDVQRRAQQVSVNGEKVGGTLLDPYKIERFGLQEYFLKRQMAAVLGDDLHNTPLAAELARRRGISTVVTAEDVSRKARHSSDSSSPLERDIVQLVSDAQVSFATLSRPVIEQFSLDGIDENNPRTMSEDQRATWRFRTVMKYLEQHTALAQYLDFDDFVMRNHSEDFNPADPENTEIWTNSAEGAAGPLGAGEAVSVVMRGALGSKDSFSATELRDLTHENRRKLLTVATHHIRELPQGGVAGTNASLKRGTNGLPELKGGFHMNQKGSEDLYAAIALGCPALRLQHPGRAELAQIEKLAVGSSNYIDHVLAIILNEAYERGMFDASKYKN